MTAHSLPSPTSFPSKRPRQSSPDKDSPTSLSAGGVTSPAGGDTPADVAGLGGASKVGQSSNFRNVSACNRCRLRKNRCDQKLPSCASCEKANVACVGYDPITKREIPRRFAPYTPDCGLTVAIWMRPSNRPIATSTTSRHGSTSSSLC